MLSFLPHSVRGVISVSLIVLMTALIFPFMLILAILKLIVPVEAIRKWLTVLIIGLANTWIEFNNFLLELMHKIQWDIQGGENLKNQDWYFVTCNHQSWSDIPIVQKVLAKKIPMLKFFLKQQLIWIPVIGLCWWALDFPFMKRYTKEDIEKRPELKGKDLETTRKACEKFKYTPVTVFSFPEGTRLTPEKHKKQNSPYKYLLRPKAGGAGFVLGAMGEMLHTMVNITIHYPDNKGFFNLFSGKIDRVVVHIDVVEIPQQYLGKDYINDEDFRSEFQSWVSRLWEEKDKLLQQLHDQG